MLWLTVTLPNATGANVIVMPTPIAPCNDAASLLPSAPTPPSKLLIPYVFSTLPPCDAMTEHLKGHPGCQIKHCLLPKLCGDIHWVQLMPEPRRKARVR